MDASGKKHVLGIPEGATEKNFRKIQGYEELWVLAAAQGRAKKSSTPQEKVA